MSQFDEGCVANLAARLIAARTTGTRIARNEAEVLARDLDEAGAYAVQSRVFELFGPAEAFKTGRKAENLPVIRAPVLAGGLRPTGSMFSPDEIGSCGVELEIGFRLDHPLPPVLSNDFRNQARDCVTAVPVIEIIDGRIEKFTQLSAPLKLADNQMNGGLVWAPASEDVGVLDLDNPTVDFRFDGCEIVNGRVPVPGGNAFDIFIAFVQAIGEHCGGFQPGQIVTTGSLTGMLFVEPGTEIAGHIAGLGSVCFSYR